jgi:hypothetical protein
MKAKAYGRTCSSASSRTRTAACRESCSRLNGSMLALLSDDVRRGPQASGGGAPGPSGDDRCFG